MGSTLDKNGLNHFVVSMREQGLSIGACNISIYMSAHSAPVPCALYFMKGIKLRAT
jgi:hypothetical protein